MNNSRFIWSTFLCWNLLFCGGPLFFFSCDSSYSDAREDDDILTRDSVYIKAVGKERTQQLAKAWGSIDSSNLTNGFYVHPDSGKVLSFEIPRVNVDSLLEQAKRLSSSSDSIYLRVHMATDLLLELDSTIKESAFRPVLDIINNKDSVLEGSVYYEMDYLNMDILKYLKGIKAKLHPDKAITLENAISYITAWDTLPVNQIYGAMYQDTIPKTDERVEYYTFDGRDTRAIIDSLGEDSKYLLYLHLGVLDQKGKIPFRTIIHLDNPANFEISNLSGVHVPPLFEFASPCPRACGK